MTRYRIEYHGPGFLSGTIGSYPFSEVWAEAPIAARRLKAQYGLHWISWKFVAE